jgi:ABC-type proline/glycine betaine transport system permease subunit
VFDALVFMFREQNFLWHIGVSFVRVWTAFLLALVMALPLGILMSTYRLAGGLNEPLIDVIRYLPVPALVPLTIIWLGIGEETKIALLWMGTFFQLVLLIADDMKRVPQEYVEIGFTLGAKPFRILKDVALPPATSGDHLVVLATGAYNASMSSNYNRIPRPAAVLVHGGIADLVQRREQPEELLRYDVLPSRFTTVS